MKLNILIFKNKKIDCFTTPQFDDHEPEVAAIQLSRSLQLNKGKDEVKPYKALDLYCLGTFEDSTGKLDLLPEPRKLLDCTVVLGCEEELISDKVEKIDE